MISGDVCGYHKKAVKRMMDGMMPSKYWVARPWYKQMSPRIPMP